MKTKKHERNNGTGKIINKNSNTQEMWWSVGKL